jgi:hypothetical protein
MRSLQDSVRSGNESRAASRLDDYTLADDDLEGAMRESGVRRDGDTVYHHGGGG